LSKRFPGTWQTKPGIDTIEVWEGRQYGKASIIDVSRVITGKKTPFYVNNMGFESKAVKYKCFVLLPDGAYTT
jgi:hypothetical protein